MRRTFLTGLLVALAAAVLTAWLAGCGRRAPRVVVSSPEDERTCLVRAMYFESNRSSRAGLMAVGTVVMNRVASRHFPNTICGVVGQHRQFAPGVMTTSVDPRQLEPAERAADAILAGQRYRPVGDAMWFHAAWLKIPYRVQYMTVAGGNAFYRRPGKRWYDTDATGSIPTAQTTEPSPNEAGDQEVAEDPGLIDKLFRTTNAQHTPCETVAASFGARSLACESEAEGR